MILKEMLHKHRFYGGCIEKEGDAVRKSHAQFAKLQCWRSKRGERKGEDSEYGGEGRRKMRRSGLALF